MSQFSQRGHLFLLSGQEPSHHPRGLSFPVHHRVVQWVLAVNCSPALLDGEYDEISFHPDPSASQLL